MADRAITRVWWIITMSLIALTAMGALLTALPDRLSGHRLAGRAQDNGRAREALAGLGLNPLMVEAFRDRSNQV